MTSDQLQKLRGRFIVFDGVDGSGKGAQIALLQKQCEAQGIEVVMARDPGGTPIGDRIRHVVLGYDLSGMEVRCETLLFMASRAQLVRDVIRPALEAGKVCLGDRFVSSTCAYQGAAGVVPEEIIELAKFAIGDTWPALTLILDVPIDDAFKRTGRKTNSQRKVEKGEGQNMLFHDARMDAMEARPARFHQQVREIYLRLPEIYPAPVRVLDGTGTVEQVQARVEAELVRMSDVRC